MMPYTPMSTPPVAESQRVTDERLAQDSANEKARTGSRDMLYETTAYGDVRTVLVQPSFDSEDNMKGGMNTFNEGQTHVAEVTRSDDIHSIQAKAASEKERRGAHKRDLSSHFFDATRLSDDHSSRDPSQGISFEDNSYRTRPTNHSIQQGAYDETVTRNDAMYFPNGPHVKKEFDGARQAPSPVRDSFNSVEAVPSQSSAINVGHKHHRGISGDLSNPAFAHRRINSIGNSAPVDRDGRYAHPSFGSYHSVQSDRPGFASAPGRHHRGDSAGLDMLSKAANVTKEELAAAAGIREQPGPTDTPWEPPSDARSMPRRSPTNSAARMSPNQGSYEYSRNPGSMGAPPPPNRTYRHPPPSHQGYHSSSLPPATNPGPHGQYHTPYHHQAPFFPPPGAPQQSYQHRGLSGQMAYPVQFAPQRGPDSYAKDHFPPPLQQPAAAQVSSGDIRTHQLNPSSSRIETDERLFGNRNMAPSPHTMSGPAGGQWSNAGRGGGTTTGVQTFVTAIGVGDGNKTMRPTSTQRNVSTNTELNSDVHPTAAAIPSTVAHHRKLSSFSSLSTIMGSGVFPEPEPHAHVGAHHRGSSASALFLQGFEDRHFMTDPMHRSTSSNVSYIFDDRNPSTGGHHRSTSSSVSFLHGLEGLEANEAFLHNLEGHGPQSRPNPPPPVALGVTSKGPYDTDYGGMHSTGGHSEPVVSNASISEGAGIVLAQGGTSKRIRRKCTVTDCPNRVVQGGLCIAHGAKRKTCKHAGCTKNVKKAGLCSTHGPARKRCEAGGCNKVAVQGGRCIAHGAKKKLCSMDGCKKQAILSGMCKKHHDQSNGIVSSRGSQRNSDASSIDSDERSATPPVCVPVGDESNASSLVGRSRPAHKPTHTRGLSIFQEISAESVQTLLSHDGTAGPAVGPVTEEGGGRNRGNTDSFNSYRMM